MSGRPVVSLWLALSLLAGCACRDRGDAAGTVSGPLDALTAAGALRPDLVLISVAGLRADTDRPFAEAALVEGLGRTPVVRFGHAYAQSCSAFVSDGSLRTGRYPSSIPLCGLRRHVGGAGAAGDWCNHIPDDRARVDEVLPLYGYEARELDLRLTRPPLSIPGVAEEPAGAPVAAPPPMRDETIRWWDGASANPRLAVVTVRELDELEHDVARVRSGDPAHAADPLTIGHDGVAPLSAYYVERARAIGEALGALLDELPRAPDGRPRVVVVTAPNGLNLAEGSGLASNHLDGVTSVVIVDRTIHVPLLLFVDGLAGDAPRRPVEVDTIVELVDVTPTLLALGGAEPIAGAPGVDLRRTVATPDPDAIAYAEFGDMLALRSGPHLLTFRLFNHSGSSIDPRMTDWLAESAVMGADGRPGPFALHDVVADPLQTRDLLAEQPELAARLREQLLAHRRGPAAPPADAFDEERLRVLREPDSGYW